MSALIELGREMIAAIDALEDKHRDRLIDFGAHLQDLALGLVGYAQIRELRGGLFEFSSDGTPALITPVRVDGVIGPESRVPDSAVRVGDIVDLLAWHPKFPDWWALRVGTAEWLGSIEPQYCDPDPVRVWRGPLGWLVNGCVGLVPLSRLPADIYRLLTNCRGGIVAEDQRHATELKVALRRPWPTPEISVVESARNAA